MVPTNRPGHFGHPKTESRKFSAASKEATRKKIAAGVTERERVAVGEILSVYKPGWTCLEERYRNSLAGIASGLTRQGLVSGFSDTKVTGLLKRLALQRKITLPKKVAKKKKAK